MGVGNPGMSRGSTVILVDQTAQAVSSAHVSGVHGVPRIGTGPGRGEAERTMRAALVVVLRVLAQDAIRGVAVPSP